MGRNFRFDKFNLLKSISVFLVVSLIHTPSLLQAASLPGYQSFLVAEQSPGNIGQAVIAAVPASIETLEDLTAAIFLPLQKSVLEKLEEIQPSESKETNWLTAQNQQKFVQGFERIYQTWYDENLNNGNFERLKGLLPGPDALAEYARNSMFPDEVYEKYGIKMYAHKFGRVDESGKKVAGITPIHAHGNAAVLLRSLGEFTQRNYATVTSSEEGSFTLAGEVWQRLLDSNTHTMTAEKNTLHEVQGNGILFELYLFPGQAECVQFIQTADHHEYFKLAVDPTEFSYTLANRIRKSPRGWEEISVTSLGKRMREILDGTTFNANKQELMDYFVIEKDRVTKVNKQWAKEQLTWAKNQGEKFKGHIYFNEDKLQLVFSQERLVPKEKKQQENIRAFFAKFVQPYEGEMIQRFMDLLWYYRKNTAGYKVLLEMLNPKEPLAEWQNLELFNTKGEKISEKILTSRTLNNDIKGPGKGGIRWETASTLNKDTVFRSALDYLNDQWASKEQVEELIRRWVSGKANALALGMTGKTAGINIPMGGGKGDVFLGKVVGRPGAWEVVDLDIFWNINKNELYGKENAARIARVHARLLAENGLTIEKDIPAPDQNTGTAQLNIYMDEHFKFLAERLKADKNFKISSKGLKKVLLAAHEIGQYSSSPLETLYLDAVAKYFNAGHAVEELGIYSAKSEEKGGARGRTEATGHGLVDVTSAFYQAHPNLGTMKGKRISVQGAGNVALHNAYLAATEEKGAIVQAISNHLVALYKESGFTSDEIDYLIKWFENSNDRKEIQDLWREWNDDKTKDAKLNAIFQNAQGYTDPNDIKRITFGNDYQIITAAALEKQIDLKVAEYILKNNQNLELIVEGANGPTLLDAEAFLHQNGITILNDTMANAGGVTVSYLETLQAVTGKRYKKEEVARMRRHILTNGFHAADKKKKEVMEKFGRNITYRMAYDLVAIDRLVAAKKNKRSKLQRFKDDAANLEAWLKDETKETSYSRMPESSITRKDVSEKKVGSYQKLREKLGLSTRDVVRIITAAYANQGASDVNKMIQKIEKFTLDLSSEERQVGFKLAGQELRYAMRVVAAYEKYAKERNGGLLPEGFSVMKRLERLEALVTKEERKIKKEKASVQEQKIVFGTPVLLAA